ncbi:MAG: SsrA-binding protein [Elusimicrobia bacterium RIFOXYA2_FULL_39_19]|nr:MAG: SsrA-binding protein [Elusimicrobia bacterium RIFOXYA2_FULL_39_19]
MDKKTIVTNRKFFHDYNMIEKYEAGLVLNGSEVKSVRNGGANLQDSYCMVERSELFVYNMHIAPYEYSGHFKFDPKRKRKLLMHRTEINKLLGKTSQRGFTLIPVELYFNNDGIAKLEIALSTRKKGPDKREMLKERDIEREVRRDSLVKRYKR